MSLIPGDGVLLMRQHKCAENHLLRQDVDIKLVPSSRMSYYEDLAGKKEERPACTARYCVYALNKLLNKNSNRVGLPVSETLVDVKYCARPGVYRDLLCDAEAQLQYAVEERVSAIESADEVNTLGALRDDVVIDGIDVGRETVREYVGEDVSDEEVVAHSLAVWMHGVALGHDIIRMWRAMYCAERYVAGRQHTASTINVRPNVRQRVVGYARMLCLLNGKRRDSWRFDMRTAAGILLIKTACVLPEDADEAEFVAQCVAIQIAGNWAAVGKDVERYEVACVWSVMNIQPEHARNTRNAIVRAVRKKNARRGYTWRQAALYVVCCVWEATSKRNAPWVPVEVVVSMLSKEVRALLSMTFVGQYDIGDDMAYAALEDVCAALLKEEASVQVEIPELAAIAFGL
ncbi:hypothetical protein BGZ46_003076 [Entomortierella lignicola]|nr:hypothetical protein BGZ46_003076 [Entomortierella lignicola]